MSTSDAFTAVGLHMGLEGAASAAQNLTSNLFSSGAQNNSVPETNYKTKYFELVEKWNNLVSQVENDNKILQMSFRQVNLLMTYINFGRIVLSQNPLTLSQIESIPDFDQNFKKAHDTVVKVGLSSKIGIISESREYWNNIKQQVFDQLSDQLHYGQSHTANLDLDFTKSDDFLGGFYGEVSGLRVHFNNKKNIEALAEINRQVNKENSNLKDENERLKEEIAKLRGELRALQVE